MIGNFFREEEGATAIEYGLIVLLISIAIIGVVGSIGQNMNTMFYGPVDTALSTVGGSSTTTTTSN